MPDIKQGTCIWFCNKKGFGFIKQDDGDKDIFVQYSHIEMEGFKMLEADQRVEYEIGENHRGPVATKVKVI